MITDNIVTENIVDWEGGGIRCRQSSPVITNNIITENTADRGGGIAIFESSPIITNNTITGNNAIRLDGGGIYCIISSWPIFTNNIITGNSSNLPGGGIGCFACPATITFDNVWGNTPDNYRCGSPGAGCISADPLFENTTIGDFHLQPNSPCIDAGTNDAVGLPEYDAEGNPRVLDGNNDGIDIVDMGAFEYERVIEVQIDIKPGSYPNSINLGSNGNVPVAIFSTEDFDATTVDPTTVTLAGALVKLKGKATPMASFEDVDGDGLLDIIVHVDTQALSLGQGDTEAILEGETSDGKKIRGVDTVRIIE